MDYLEKYRGLLDADFLLSERASALAPMQSKGNIAMSQAIEALAGLPSNNNDFDKEIVRIGDKNEVSDEKRSEIKDLLKEFIPWRKGPFEIFGIEIDAEWQSQHKWSILEPYLPDLKGKKICDIGANSGYYMYRMAAHDPEFVLGLDPTLKYWAQFQALQQLTAPNQLAYEPLGLECLDAFPKFFDVIFCMGILYHHRNPLGILQTMYDSLEPGGEIVIESQAIPGTAPIALFPEKAYGNVKGNYFIPTTTCLKNWLLKMKFKDVEIFAEHKMSSDIQRQTEWMPFRTYSDQVDEDTGLTIEGYPAPIRIFAKAKK